LQGACEIAGINGVEMLVRKATAQRLRLPPSFDVQWHIQMPLHASLGIPSGFTMTHQQEFGRGIVHSTSM
jgi:hypothetical protein